jgi:hypothetical protein
MFNLARLPMSFEQIAEERIREAMAAGEFDDLPGRGRPIDLDGYFATPADIRLGYSLLKSGGFVPEEVELLREIARLEQELPEAQDPGLAASIRRSIEEQRLRLRLMLETFRRPRRR